MVNNPQIVKIENIINETPTIKTFEFMWDMDKYGRPNPGEFVMVWNFFDEKPMSISNIGDDTLSITVKNIGKFTSQLHNLKIGDEIGIRGSYGNGFNNNMNNKNIIVVGGGVGMAPVKCLASQLSENNNVDVISAATTSEELLFVDYLNELGANVYPCTDDGSFGFKGFATDCLKDLLKSNEYDFAFVCGPEVMMSGIYDIIKEQDIPAQYSLERYMKCAMGLCGQCCVDNTGWRICVEGPVFDSESIEKIIEFGKYRRDASGLKY